MEKSSFDSYMKIIGDFLDDVKISINPKTKNIDIKKSNYRVKASPDKITFKSGSQVRKPKK
jgi:hypothetical protein